MQINYNYGDRLTFVFCFCLVIIDETVPKGIPNCLVALEKLMKPPLKKFAVFGSGDNKNAKMEDFATISLKKPHSLKKAFNNPLNIKM